MTKLHDLHSHGQSIWLDFIRRSFLESGELQTWLAQGVRGVTSNPTIFEKAIAGSTDYDRALQQLSGQGKSLEQLYEALALEDIGNAADQLRPLYDASNGADGFVSLEVSPSLAHDTAGTIGDAKRLFRMLNRPNVMIKIPATPAGIPAIQAVIAAGINVNVTLIFSVAQYRAVAEAYLRGLEEWVAGGGEASKVASVASFFVSRLDSVIDPLLEKIGRKSMMGKAAIDNARIAYAAFGEIFSGARWETLTAKGARVQRPLWASTGVKNPAYPDTLYVDQLIGPDTVNTVPPATLDAFLDHGAVASTLMNDLAGATMRVNQLHALGIELDAITQRLLDDAVASFAKSFDSLLASIKMKQSNVEMAMAN